MSAPDDPGLWKEILAGFISLVTAVFSWMFKDVHERIKEAKAAADTKLSKDDFDAHLERSMDERKNLRADVKELFVRDDRMKDVVNERFEALRRDMHEGFDRLSREIRTREGRS